MLAEMLPWELFSWIFSSACLRSFVVPTVARGGLVIGGCALGSAVEGGRISRVQRVPLHGDWLALLEPCGTLRSVDGGFNSVKLKV